MRHSKANVRNEPYPGVSVGPLEPVAFKSPSREVEVTFNLGLLYQQQAAHTHMASGKAWSVVSGGDAVGASRHFFSRAPEVHPRRWCTRTTRLGRLCRGSRARAHDAKWTRDRRCRRTRYGCRRTSAPVPHTVSYAPYLSVQDDHRRCEVSGSGVLPEVHLYVHQLACSCSMQMPIRPHANSCALPL